MEIEKSAWISVTPVFQRLDGRMPCGQGVVREGEASGMIWDTREDGGAVLEMGRWEVRRRGLGMREGWATRVLFGMCYSAYFFKIPCWMWCGCVSLEFRGEFCSGNGSVGVTV